MTVPNLQRAAVLLCLFCAFLLWAPPATSQDAEPPVDLAPVIEALKDEATRDRLIEALEVISAADGSDTPPLLQSEESIEPPATSELQGFARRTADATAEITQSIVARTQALWRDIQRLEALPEVLTQERRARIAAEAPLLAVTFLATVLIYRALRILARRAVSPPPPEAPLLQRSKAVFVQAALRAVGLLLAWVAGYALSFTVGGGEVAVAQALYLNGFLIAGAMTFCLSIFVSHDPRDVTLSALAPASEAAIFRNVKRVASLLIYGVVTIVPIAQLWTNFVIARSLRSVIITLGFILALLAIRKIARVMRADRDARAADPDEIALPEDADTLPDLVATTTESVWSKLWPPLAVIYVVFAYWTALTQPNLMVELLGRSTAFTITALALLILSVRLIGAAGSLHLHMPKVIAKGLPSFKERLHGFLPALVMGVGLVGVITSIVLVVRGWDLALVPASIDGALAWRVASAATIIAATLLIWAFFSAWVDTRLTPDGPKQTTSARSRTLLALSRNAVTIFLLVTGLMTALSELGINIAPLLAGAGVIGLAIGFGAQKLVHDIITGVFIQLENAINEGDVVTVAGVTGAVESLTIRSVGVRDLYGTFHLIPFSAVDTVANFMRGHAYHVEVIGVAYDSDLSKVRAAMEEAFQNLRRTEHGKNIIGSLEMHGVVALGDSSVNVRARTKTRPGQQWGVGRSYTEEVKTMLDKYGVEIPYPHREIRLPPEMLQRLAPKAASTE